MKEYIFLIIATLISLFSHGQTDLAIINDPDGYVNIRVDKNADSEIITTLKEGDLFLCEPTNDNWWKVDNFHSQTGFVQKSRIILIKNKSDNDQREMIIKSMEGLKNYRQKYDSLRSILPNDQRLELLREFENFEETVYTPLLTFLSGLFCKNKDVDLLDKFLVVIVANQMSANESPAWTLGECYLCYPDLILQKIDKYKGKNKEYLKNTLIFGFENITLNKENEIKDYQRLKVKLNE